MNNWVADLPTPLKYMEAISEARSDIGERGRPPYDDTYGMSPVNYVKLDRLPTVDDVAHERVDCQFGGAKNESIVESIVPSPHARSLLDACQTGSCRGARRPGKAMSGD